MRHIRQVIVRSIREVMRTALPAIWMALPATPTGCLRVFGAETNLCKTLLDLPVEAREPD